MRTLLSSIHLVLVTAEERKSTNKTSNSSSKKCSNQEVSIAFVSFKMAEKLESQRNWNIPTAP